MTWHRLRRVGKRDLPCRTTTPPVRTGTNQLPRRPQEEGTGGTGGTGGTQNDKQEIMTADIQDHIQDHTVIRR